MTEKALRDASERRGELEQQLAGLADEDPPRQASPLREVIDTVVAVAEAVELPGGCKPGTRHHGRRAGGHA